MTRTEKFWEILGWLLCEASFRINAWIGNRSGLPWGLIYEGFSWPAYHFGCSCYGRAYERTDAEGIKS